MSLPDLLPIPPFTRPARGSVTLPGSKSITNRALLLAALSHGSITLTGALFSEDTEIMAAALNQVGIEVKSDPVAKTFAVIGRDGVTTEPKEMIWVGNAGTAARFLTALCAAAKSGVYRLDGVKQMRKRPMKGLIDALRTLGADIRCTEVEGVFPLEIHARGLHGTAVTVDAVESSQMLSALLMVAPLYGFKVEATLDRQAFVRMTERMIQQFSTARGNYAIEPDLTAASYFLALPLVAGGMIALPGLLPGGASLQGDGAFSGALNRIQARTAGEPLAIDFREFSDTFLTLAAIAPVLDGPITITGIAHTRKQETDRVAGMATELRKLRQGVVEEHDSLTITPNQEAMRRLAEGGPIAIETYHDHRFAMSFGILGCHDLFGNGQPWLAIKNPGCCAKTFPNFFDVLAQVRADSHANSPQAG